MSESQASVSGGGGNGEGGSEVKSSVLGVSGVESGVGSAVIGGSGVSGNDIGMSGDESSSLLGTPIMAMVSPFGGSGDGGSTSGDSYVLRSSTGTPLMISGSPFGGSVDSPFRSSGDAGSAFAGSGVVDSGVLGSGTSFSVGGMSIRYGASTRYGGSTGFEGSAAYGCTRRFGGPGPFGGTGRYGGSVPNREENNGKKSYLLKYLVIPKVSLPKSCSRADMREFEEANRPGVKMEDDVVRQLRVAKVFRENTERINSMDFAPSGDLLISSAEDDQIVIYDCEKGTQKRTLNSKKYGVDLIHFTHAKNTAIHSSTKIDDTIRYLSLHDNKYLRYFPGHTKKVTTLCMSPTDDTFLSGSLDKTLRLWDLRSPNCQGLMHLQGRPVAAFDPEGLIFAAGVNNESIKLYDLRSFDKGPFTTFRFSYEKDNEWASLKFSPDGKSVMICSYGNVIRLVDAFHGTPLQTFTGFVNNQKLPLEATFSPDSQYVFSGSGDGIVHVWNAEKGYKVCVLNGDHPGAVQCVQFNPKYMMVATACTNMAFWLPVGFEDLL